MSNKPVKSKSSGLRALDGALVVVAGVVGVVIAFAVLHFVVGQAEVTRAKRDFVFDMQSAELALRVLKNDREGFCVLRPI